MVWWKTGHSLLRETMNQWYLESSDLTSQPRSAWCHQGTDLHLLWAVHQYLQYVDRPSRAKEPPEILFCSSKTYAKVFGQLNLISPNNWPEEISKKITTDVENIIVAWCKTKHKKCYSRHWNIASVDLGWGKFNSMYSQMFSAPMTTGSLAPCHSTDVTLEEYSTPWGCQPMLHHRELSTRWRSNEREFLLQSGSSRHVDSVDT